MPQSPTIVKREGSCLLPRAISRESFAWTPVTEVLVLMTLDASSDMLSLEYGNSGAVAVPNILRVHSG